MLREVSTQAGRLYTPQECALTVGHDGKHVTTLIQTRFGNVWFDWPEASHIATIHPRTEYPS